MSLYVDPDELDRAAGVYTGAATDTADLVDTCPTSVDAGLATGPLTGMLAQIVTDLAGMVELLGGTGGLLTTTAQTYRDADDETAAALVRAWSE
ncbi:hypothetical protein AB0P13_12425 [Rhodococcus pyridinivorans]|uniref:ESX-1 secretion-associated protein n=1 Tax=Rhodococcus pyridinivorans SB3094 TaxID=1435356 RepID=V9XNU7_9NOCA|nr:MULTISPECIES: hypothetical protein [Rhodococcus]AHD23665.1 hypothetical protein Y013_07820 [Rhodococcus pyridinivorans SB3094]MCT7292409.1 hypothetical protein [Rhodococcus sp. PAE-6]